MTRIARPSFLAWRIAGHERGSRRERVFFEDGDYALYRDWLGESCRSPARARRGTDTGPESPPASH